MFDFDVDNCDGCVGRSCGDCCFACCFALFDFDHPDDDFDQPDDDFDQSNNDDEV